MSYFPTVLPVRLADAAAAVPNRRAIVEQVHRDFPHLLRHNTRAADTEFLQRVLAAMPPGERWGHLSKDAGEAGHTLPNGVRISHDVIALPDGNRIDVINGADFHPNPGGPTWSPVPQFGPNGDLWWRPSNVWTPQQPLFDSGTPGGAQPAHVAELGIGWFCLLRALQDWPGEVTTNLAYLRATLKPKVYRVFLDLEGLSHVQGNNPDPWRDAGIDGRASNWSDLFKRALDLLGNAGEQMWCTVYGGRNHFPQAHSRRAFHDRIVQAAQGRWGAIYGLEVANEYIVNRFEDAEVRDAGIDLRSKIPVGTRLALSSPRYAHSYVNDDHEASNEEMGESIDALYDRTGASVMGVHKMRDARSKWADPFAYNGYRPDLPKIDQEPFGDGASAGGDTSDPRLIAADYQRTCEAGWSLYIAHPASWCIWNARLPAEYPLTQHRFVKDVPHIAECFRLLRAVRDGGAIEPRQPGQPGVPEMPLPDRAQALTFARWLDEFYQKPEGLQRPNGLSLDGKPDLEAIGAWMFDVWLKARVAGKTEDDARALVVAEIQKTAEWKAKHAA